ncbi:Fc.00g103670.m01.CDS01 [Cosmosporella sp. VM-42]
MTDNQYTILKTFGWSSLKSYLLSAPIRIADCMVSVLVGLLAGKLKRRGRFCVTEVSGTWGCTSPLLESTFVNLSWSPGVSTKSLVTSSAELTPTVFAVTCGHVGGIISAIMFPNIDGPDYFTGISIRIPFQAVGIIAAIINIWVFCHDENRQQDLGKRDHLREPPEDEINKLGEKHPNFRYTT